MVTPSVLPISEESTVLRQTRTACGDVLADTTVAVALLHGGVLHFLTEAPVLEEATWHRILRAVVVDSDRPADPPDPERTEVVLPLLVRHRPAGILLARRSAPAFSASELALLRVITDRVAAATENGRLQANLVELLAEYMSADVASTLIADPGRSELGGETRDVSVLFADLTGFTSFSERTPPAAVVALLNRMFGEAVPAIVENGGTVSAFIGDAIMGLFGAPQEQPEHPLLAARAALAIQEATAPIAAQRPELPRFRVGVTTGPAVVGNVGSPRRRVFTAIGDTVNLASRLEGVAPPGGVVIGAETYAIIRSFAEVRPLAPLVVKGKADPVQAYELVRLRADSDARIGSQTITMTLPESLRRQGRSG